MCDIYAVITGHSQSKDVSKLNVERINSWRDTMFFSVPDTHGVGNMLFAPASCTKDPCPDDRDPLLSDTRHLVPVIPKGADVRITTLTPIVTDANDTDHYMHHDLRCDIVIHNHDNADHASLHDTEAHVRAMCWFPGMHGYIRYHCDSCTYCVAKRAAVQDIGVAVRAARRLKMVQFDFKVLDDEVKLATKRSAVLTIVDSATGVTVFAPVRDQTATTTARTLFNKWHSIFGVPAMFKCDGDPAYTSQVMAEFARLMGVKSIDFSAPNEPTQHSLVERRNEILEKHIDVGVAKGDITCAQDLSLYCAMAMTRCNLEHYRDGMSSLERLTGEVPRTQRDLASKLPAQALATPITSAYVKQLRTLLAASDAVMQFSRDDDARDSALQRHERLARTRGTRFDLRVGDKVSHNGECFTIVNLIRNDSQQPLKADIRSVGHDNVVVHRIKYCDLRPLNTQRPVIMRSQSTTAANVPHAQGDFVFYTDPDDDSSVKAGVVLSIGDASRSAHGDTTHVHEYQRAPKVKTRYTGLYTDTQTQRIEARVKPTTTQVKVVVHIRPSAVHAAGTISSSLHIDDHLRAHVTSTGVTDSQ